MSLEVKLKHEASLEVNMRVSPFKCLKRSNHLAFGDTLSLGLCPTDWKLNVSDLLLLVPSFPEYTETQDVGPLETSTNSQTFTARESSGLSVTHAPSQAAPSESLLH